MRTRITVELADEFLLPSTSYYTATFIGAKYNAENAPTSLLCDQYDMPP